MKIYSKLTYSIAVLFVIYKFTQALDLAFNECGEKKGVIVGLRSKTCKSDPCDFVKGEISHIEIDFIPEENHKNLTVSATASAFFMEIDIPVKDPYPCGEFIKCPLQKDVINKLDYEFFIEDSYPSVSSTLKLKIDAEDEKPVACLEVEVALVDGPIQHQEL